MYYYPVNQGRISIRSENIGIIWDKRWNKIQRFEDHIDVIRSKDPWTKHHFEIIDKELKKLSKAGKFFEAGCGLGQWCFYARALGINSIGIDISKKAIEQLNIYVKINNLQDVSFVYDDLRNLSNITIKNSKFDFFVCLGVIEHFNDEDSRKILDNLYALTEIGGSGLITGPNVYCFHSITRPLMQLLGIWDIGYERSFSPRALRKIVEEAGFKVEKSGVIPSGDIFGSFLNNIPILGNIFVNFSYFIENHQNVIGFISFVKVTK